MLSYRGLSKEKQIGDPLLHFPGCLVGEGESKDFFWGSSTRTDLMDDPVGKGHGLAGTGPGDD